MKLLFILLSLWATLLLCSCSDKIRLSDISTLTLYSNKKTNGRRSPGVPQLECVGGSAGCSHKYIPNVVQCTNVGSDGYDVQWKCNAELETTVKFGTIDVSCEGYDYPNDKYILKGSCGLRYTLDRSSSHSGNSYHQKTNQKSSDSNISSLLILVFIVIAVIIGVCWYNSVSAPLTPSCPPPPGFRPEYAQPNVPPPSYSNIYGEPKYAGQTNTGPGFWTGLGAGGLAGYLFGSSGTRHRQYDSYTPYAHPETRFTDEDSHSRRRSPTPEFRTASGFGGTSRR